VFSEFLLSVIVGANMSPFSEFSLSINILSFCPLIFDILKILCSRHTSREVKWVEMFLHHRCQDYLLRRWVSTNSGYVALKKF